ncbi:chaperonin GroEL [Candidatus Methylocalor cossyra]|uniref:60 kDa chaperonin n=1 Tax=Candidatus Methylocalor cossyra TaxID=3108543 RepID=A0ABM9NEX3_9GAMM
MSKRVVFDGAARAGMLKGVDILGRAVEATYGYHGPCVMVEHRTRGLAPVFTRDGVTVANAVVLKDRLAELGARMLRDVANGVARQAGDGTTTAVVLARAIARGMWKSLSAGADPLRLKQGMEGAVDWVVSDLRSRALPVVGERVAQVAEVSMRRDGAVGRLLQEAFAAVGQDGVVTVAPGFGRADRWELVEGFRYEAGVWSPYLVTDGGPLVAARVLIYHGTVTDFVDLVPILEQVREAGQALVLVCEGMEERPLRSLALNVRRGTFRALAVKAPGLGDRRRDWLDDLAVATGARVLVPELGDRLDRVRLADLGFAGKVVADADTTTLIQGGGDRAAIARRIAGLRKEAEVIRALGPGEGSPTGKRHDLDDLEARIAALGGRIATVYIGGVSEAEVKERLQRAENARRSVLAALEEGVVPGGGVGLLHARAALARLGFSDPDRQRGAAIIGTALEQPFRLLVAHAGQAPDSALARVQAAGHPHWGFDAASGEFCDLVERGVLDPLKTLRLALTQAAGVVGTVLASGVVVMGETAGLPDLGFSPEWAAATREDPRR